MNLVIETEALIEAGLNEVMAAHLIDKINGILAEHDIEDCWTALTREVLDPSVPFVLHAYLYKELAACWPEAERGPMPAWHPSIAHQANANIKRLAERVNIQAFHDLFGWSNQNRGDYWEIMVELLGIVFRHPYREVLDTSAGVERARWFPEGRLNIADSCFSAEPGQAAIVWRDGPDEPVEEMSYAELELASNRVANSLVVAGFREGDAIAIDMAMSPASVAIYLGIVKAGCRVISIADSFSPAEIATRLRIGEARGIFTTDYLVRGGKRFPMYEKVIQADAPHAIVLPAGTALDMELRDGDQAWTEFLVEDVSFSGVEADPDAIINILFSSGTTGEPKAIPWDHTTPIKAAADGYLHQNIKPGQVVCWPTNLGWMMGPWLIFATLINRGTIALYGDAPGTRDFCRFVQDAGVDILGVVPSLVKAWRQHDALDDIVWRNIELFSSTGECSNENDMLWLMSRAGYRPVIEYCGGTEIGGGYLTGTVVQAAVPAAFATPAMGLDMVILDEAGEEAETGEVYLVPPSIGFSSRLLNRDHHEVYFADVPEDAAGRTLRRHGDQIERLPGGFFRAHGRADDTMNLGGIKTSSAEIERVLEEISDIDEAAAIAVSPEGGGPSQLIVFAVMLVERDRDSLFAELREAIRVKLNPLFKIHEVVVLDALPRTASGKVMRRVLRRRYLRDRAAP